MQEQQSPVPTETQAEPAAPTAPSGRPTALPAPLHGVWQWLARHQLGSFDWLPWTMLGLCIAAMAAMWWNQSAPRKTRAAVAIPTAVAAPRAATPRVFDLTTRRWPAPCLPPAASSRSLSSKLLSAQALEEMQVT